MADPARSIADRTRQVIADTVGTGATLPADTMPVADLTDSLEAVAILTALEEEFGIDLPDEEFFDADTVGAVIKVVEAKIG